MTMYQDWQERRELANMQLPPHWSPNLEHADPSWEVEPTNENQTGQEENNNVEPIFIDNTNETIPKVLWRKH